MSNSFQTCYHVTFISKRKSILRDGLKAKIGPRSRELGETTPGVYLFPSLEDCDTALGGWLGDYFENSDPIIFEVQVDPAHLESDVEYELRCLVDIPADQVTYFGDEMTLYEAMKAQQPTL